MAGVDSVVHVLEKIVDDVACTETEGWSTGIEVLPVVSDVGNSKVTLIFGSVAVGVTYEGALEVVVHNCVGDSDKVGSVGDVQKSIIEVLFRWLDRGTTVW